MSVKISLVIHQNILNNIKNVTVTLRDPPGHVRPLDSSVTNRELLLPAYYTEKLEIR